MARLGDVFRDAFRFSGGIMAAFNYLLHIIDGVTNDLSV